MELDLHVAAEHGDSHDHRLYRPVAGLVEQLEVVGPDERSAHDVGIADEAHDELGGRCVVQLLRSTDLLECAVVDHRDRVRDLHRLLLVVGDEDRRHVHDVVELPQPLAQLGADARVEGAERLVEQQHLRFGREGARQAHALALPARELGGIAVAEALELDEVEQLVHALADLGPGPPPHLEAEGDVVSHRHVLEGGVVLEDEADVALLRRERRRVLAGEEDLAGVGRLEPGDDAQQGRLPGAARPEQRRQRAALHLEGDVVDRDEVPEALRDVADGDGHQAACSSRGRITVMPTSTRIAASASTIEIAYAPARSKLS